MFAYVPRPTTTPTGSPPLWFVSHRDQVVGPVSTTRLVRGLCYGRIPSTSHVRERTWTEWRNIERVREVAALRREQARHGHVEVPRARFHPTRAASAYRAERLRRALLNARDPGEVLLLGLTEIMRVTDACVGAVHRARAPHIGLVTSSASGPGMISRLGHVIPGDDPSLHAAALDGEICEPAFASAVSRRICERLGTIPASAGVAMVPLTVAGRVYAMIELGRPDHHFRLVDMKQIRNVVDAARDRLETVRNPAQS